jgi:NAD(P)-dependent dehydrogenase (short-subunit alcohol dehydrogenase family)
MPKTWLITGSSRGLGRELTTAALENGDHVVATARRPEQLDDLVAKYGDRIRAVALDVTDQQAAQAAVRTAVEAFGSLDVVANNAGYANSAPIEDTPDDDFRAQLETNLFGPLNVTRAVLPVMRAQRAGHVVTISSTAGLVGQEFCTAYAASKFALEGWMESLTPEVAPFGIGTTIVEPGFFRTDLLSAGSTNYAAPSIDDYAERTRQTVDAWNGMNGRQGGDPAKLAAALVQLTGQAQPPLRWVAGADAVQGVEQKAKDLLAQVAAHRELSSSLAHDDAPANA